MSSYINVRKSKAHSKNITRDRWKFIITKASVHQNRAIPNMYATNDGLAEQ